MLDCDGGEWIRTIVGGSQQIYSLPPLATWVLLRMMLCRFMVERTRSIKEQLAPGELMDFISSPLRFNGNSKPSERCPSLLIFKRAGGRTRTPDLLITNQLLYQLSYTSK